MNPDEAPPGRGVSIRKKYLILAAVLLIADRFTKELVRANMFPGQTLKVLGKLLHITYVTNTGIAFGMAPGRNFFFLGVTIAILLLLLVFFLKTKDKKELLPAILIMTGAAGNIIDRLLYGSVCDFVEVNLGFAPFKPWPIFNLADSLITIGGILLFYFEFFLKKETAS